MQPSFNGLLRQLFKVHMNSKSVSVEVTCALLDILNCVSREAEWATLFTNEEETKEVLEYLVSSSLTAPTTARGGESQQATQVPSLSLQISAPSVSTPAALK